MIILGAGIMLFTAISKSAAQVLPQNEPQQTQFLEKPAKLYIPRLAKILYISDGQVVDNRWTISETGVSYLTTSAIPGQVGNSVIYGHNRNEILGDLPQVVDGDPIYVILESGDFVKYQVAETKVIQPSQVEILNQSADSRLTIYTCTGFLDTARFVVVARQVGLI
ncbi:hypothetical protein A3H87_04405 [Candidatus Curtissbacteria bacterium RIFCSPLOWO2_02_FULL_42_37]|uniref:Sortase n=1 Tax=Candidatus Curtissbacteria bacterium RIFCSPLOWO2_01_FULL_42_50 TaxID=1797730 RepID=A0A1F5H620_9BACT|nr:MAG: hypothetical protein A3B54_03390 [Candidatus Curtissbacteria bacterium RIFCSPLOWO2_01_FULL_42_50]OGE11779.1 MAG: hypothetical protein A3H87_04405 [Candidatus Curtissbacteria bacterium RIFCSPLOWO2_02_FULL_42_37]